MLYRLFYRKLRSLSLPLLAAVLFSMSGMAHAQQSAPADDGSATLRTLEQTLIPAADRIDLAQRLRNLLKRCFNPKSTKSVTTRRFGRPMRAASQRTLMKLNFRLLPS